MTTHRLPIWIWKAVVWSAALAVVTAGMVPFRGRLNDAHVTIGFLVVVIGAGAHSGRKIGFAVATLAFLSFDWFFVLPYDTLAVDKPLDWVVLAAFLVMSMIVTQLFEHARRESAEAQRAKEREAIVASVSHDLRTPLTTIKALAHTLAESGEERAELIEAEADRLTTLVGDLLDFSRINSGSLPVAIEANEAEDLIGAALQQVMGSSKGREIKVSLDPDHPLLFARFDFTHTLRVVVNLIENALKYSPVSSAVDLAVKRDGPWLAFTVADRGMGIAPAERARIFEPFYRPDGVAADTKGVGLGLSIARALAEIQGGTLTYAEREGGGSQFTLRLPAMDVPDMAGA
jgi:two-component system sensor histidine kinase KdpD